MSDKEEEKKRTDEKISSAHKFAGTAGTVAAGLAGAPHPHLGGAAAHAGLEAVRLAKHAQIDAKHSDNPTERAIGQYLEWDSPSPLPPAAAAAPIVLAVRGIFKLFS